MDRRRRRAGEAPKTVGVYYPMVWNAKQRLRECVRVVFCRDSLRYCDQDGCVPRESIAIGLRLISQASQDICCRRPVGISGSVGILTALLSLVRGSPHYEFERGIRSVELDLENRRF